MKIVLPDVTNLLNAGGSKQRPASSNQQSAISIQHSANSKQQRAVGNQQSAISNQKSVRPLSTLGWHRIDTDVNGEWGYYLVLDQFLNAAAESKRAAAGWGGDRYALYEGPNGQVFLAQVAVWDTENDAREFFDAYVKRTELRYPDAKQSDPADAETQARNSKLESRNSYSWQTSEGQVVIELRGQRVVIVEGIPKGVDSNALLSAVSQ